MTHQEREYLCQVLAALFCPPGPEDAGQVQQGAVHAFFQKVVRSWNEDEILLNGFRMEGSSDAIRDELVGAHERLFSGIDGERICLVESFYKPWTKDPRCSLSFASEQGLLMGDSALHLRDVYRQCNLEVGEEFRNTPDHLCMELEFLSFLYRGATDAQIRRFIDDHLDWISSLKCELDRVCAPPFYRSLTDVLILFLDRERERLEVMENGEKKVDSDPFVSSGLWRDGSSCRLLKR
jgi:putative dimethyl sulfoxide reductase chaperone